MAFLGRLNPVGILVAALFLALTFIGGESAQISLKVPLDRHASVFQGMLLFFVLACDTLILYRVRFDPARRRRPMEFIEAILLTVVAASTPLLLAGVRRTRHRARGRAEPRRRGHDDRRRGLRVRGRVRDRTRSLVGALCGIARRARRCRPCSRLLTLGLAANQVALGPGADHSGRRPLGADRRWLRRRRQIAGAPNLYIPYLTDIPLDRHSLSSGRTLFVYVSIALIVGVWHVPLSHAPG